METLSFISQGFSEGQGQGQGQRPPHAELPIAVRWGIIGCGDVCEVKSGPALYKAPNSRLVAVMRRDEERVKDFAARHNVPRWYTSVDELLQDPEVDAVYIATPPGTHKEIALKVAEARKPCLLEKPMARSKEECEVILQAFEEKRLPLYVAYYRRYLPKFVAVKQAIEDRAIGTVTGISIRLSRPDHRDSQNVWRVNPESSGGGLFLDLGSHILDLCDFFFGPVTQVCGFAKRLGPTRSGQYPVEDNVRMCMCAGQVPATLACNFACDVSEDTFEIQGSEGVIRFSCFDQLSATLITSTGAQLFLQRGTDEQVKHVHLPLISAITSDLLAWHSDPSEFFTVGPQCSATGVAGLRTSAAMDEVLNTFYGGREEGFWRRTERRDP